MAIEFRDSRVAVKALATDLSSHSTPAVIVKRLGERIIFTMTYLATVIPVMIASPGDVAAERDVVRGVLHEWNDLYASTSSRVLLPVGWDTHAAPDLGGRAQELINTRVLKECDLLVGIFWSRLGTPTGLSESGTVEEIKEHHKAGKPTMIYFSTVPIAQHQLVDKRFQEDWDALQSFKAWCKNQGLYWEFDNLGDFRDKFRRHIQIMLRDNEYFHEAGDIARFDLEDLVDEEPMESGLSNEAKVLLKEASRDQNGVIMSVRFIGGQVIQTNGRNLVDSGDRRSVARWEAALAELLDNGLVIPRGHKGEVFEVTDAGYRLADTFPDL